MKKILAVQIGATLLWLSSAPVALAGKASFIKKFNSEDISYRESGNWVYLHNLKLLEKFKRVCGEEGGRYQPGRVEAGSYCWF
ncbi:hypothetical protein [Okeania sp.]|uniref:hypothetical protein n=1 Tax=Okeania sp. TaxID=3100323 RepID=UPI002B4B75FE|nr:hypothetical protein [Okeania sp.]MEB3340813.1 hypothetical protein [Okeania sp.]